ncbi:hypothetical protein GCM10022222_17840 [Amycolatopsis ultiminotia]|uniref:Uncharacterized protein n=1 Tax=Amycolatopsis ultiminotia TaxID=543629 RepID=A0ABP6VJ25_9PSEU
MDHGGHTDSTDSGCGNLIGAIHGDAARRGARPDRWELREVITGLADEALVDFGTDPQGDDRWFECFRSAKFGAAHTGDSGEEAESALPGRGKRTP